MRIEVYNVVGVMSGTSLDGIDIAHIIFEINNNKWSFEILCAETISYSEIWIEKLRSAINFSIEDLELLDIEYTKLLANEINKFIDRYDIKNLDVICSHGHTILHQPQNGFTLQIGNLPEIAKLTGKKVVCDFRVQDVKLGGQGAPLVPIGDRLLFPDFFYCLNLGGFSNVSFEEGGKRIAFDISPVNTVLNFYANKLGFDYDDKGKIASTGNISIDLLKELNNLEYYSRDYPKSLGFEFVKGTIIPIIESYEIEIEDKICTFTEHVAIQLQRALNNKHTKLFITGGGVYNIYLIQRIQNYLPEMEIIVPEDKIIQYKEALIFGLLGVLKLRGEINVLSSVTGAKNNHSSGVIFN